MNVIDRLGDMASVLAKTLVAGETLEIKVYDEGAEWGDPHEIPLIDIRKGPGSPYLSLRLIGYPAECVRAEARKKETSGC